MAGKEPSPCDPARLPHIEVYTYDGVVKFIYPTCTTPTWTSTPTFAVAGSIYGALIPKTP